jgi:hypothetical protein
VAEAQHGVLREGLKGDAHKREQVCDEYKPEISALFRESGVKDQETDEPFEGVVAEGALELDRDERPESGEAARLHCGLRVGLARWWRHGCAEFIGSPDCGQALH